MASIFHGWSRRLLCSGLGAALLSLSVGCTQNSTNTLPSRDKLPPPKTVTGTLPLNTNSPAYNNLHTNTVTPGVNPYHNPAATNPSFNPSTIPTTRIGGPENVRADSRSGMNPPIGVPTNTVGNPASFNGPSGGVNPIQPINYTTTNNPPSNNTSPYAPVNNPNPPQMQPLTPMQPVGNVQNNRLPAMSPLPGTTQNNTSAPAWPNTNPAPQYNTTPNNPANWNAPQGNPNNNGNNYNPVPPAPPLGLNNVPSTNQQPLKLPETISAKPSNNPAITPVGNTVPPLGNLEPLVDNTPSPIMAPTTKVISTIPPRRDNVPPVIIGSDDIPAAPLMPQR